jgi:hypothetical protein
MLLRASESALSFYQSYVGCFLFFYREDVCPVSGVVTLY